MSCGTKDTIHSFEGKKVLFKGTIYGNSVVSQQYYVLMMY